MRLPNFRWLGAQPAAMFYTMAAGALTGRAAAPGAGEIVVETLSGYVLGGCVALWLLADARGRGFRWAYDADTLLAWIWPVAAPLYLFNTRGWRAFFPLGIFALLALAAMGVGEAGEWVRWFRVEE